MKIITKQMRDRLIWREGISRQYDAAFTLSFRGARFVSLHACREDVVRWLNRQSTPNTRGLGRKTYAELCQAFGMAVPAKGSSTLGAQLAKAHQRIAELEARIEKLELALKRIRDCDWVITLPDRMDAVRTIAREVLQ